MRRSTRSAPSTWRLAFGPALFMMAMALSSHASATDAQTYSKVSAEEGRVSSAIAARDGSALKRSVSALGPLIDAALKRREAGGTVSACDMAAHSLGFVAVLVAESLAHEGEARKMLVADATAAGTDFRKDMQACEKLNSRKTGSHTTVEKALRAL